jgi:hypothetical protein
LVKITAQIQIILKGRKFGQNYCPNPNHTEGQEIWSKLLPKSKSYWRAGNLVKITAQIQIILEGSKFGQNYCPNPNNTEGQEILQKLLPESKI